jgi:hypothetical protein
MEQLADVALKQLQQAQEIRNMAAQAQQLTQLLIKKLNSSHQSLSQIRPLFAEHIHVRVAVFLGPFPAGASSAGFFRCLRLFLVLGFYASTSINPQRIHTII